MNFIIKTLFGSFISFNLWAQELIPLSVGNEWTYAVTTFENGIEISKDTTTNKVLSSHSINGNTWYLMEEFGTLFTVRNTKKGQYELDSSQTDNKDLFLESLVFKTPTQEPQQYISNYDNQITISDTTTIIETPYGNFNAYRYFIEVSEMDNYSVENYIYPSIGIVYQTWIDGSKIVKHELIKFNLL